MTRQRTDNNHIEAAAEGRDAFWRGLVVMMNPHVGADARRWTAAWRQAEGDLLARSGAGRACPGGQYPAGVLAAFRPADIDPPRRRAIFTQRGAGRRRARMLSGKDPLKGETPIVDPKPVAVEGSTGFRPGDTPWART